nr:unnamed protein product [Spirometra erinaceieuropaei]
MFNHLQRCLLDEYAEELCYLLIHCPLEQPYDKVRDALVKRVAMTEERRLLQLLTGEELGDRKPSQLLRRMQQPVDERKFDTTILRQLFLQRLPLDVQTVLAVSQGSMEELAELADKVLRGLDFVYAYIDDLLVASTDAAEHEIHLRQLFERLDSYGVIINAAKSDSEGIKPIPEKGSAISAFPVPTTINQLRRFLGIK